MQAVFVIEVFLVATMKERKTGQINWDIFIKPSISKILSFQHLSVKK